MATTVDFISRDVSAIAREVIAAYEAETGKALQPAQVETLLFNAQTYREGIIRAQFNDACNQNFVRNARGAVLDYLGERLGVVRLAAQRAQTVIEIVCALGVDPTGFDTLPAGTQFSNSDGSLIYETIQDQDTEDPAGYFTWAFSIFGNVGVWSIRLRCEAQEGGAQYNDLALGIINTWLSGGNTDFNNATLFTIRNITVPSGGTDDEDDENLRQRIYLAPNQFSVAGPVGAYEFFARTANSNIVDVAVTNPIPGTAKLWPLYIPEGQTDPITTPTDVLNAVFAACNDETRRPICDRVEVESPTIVNQTILVQVVRYVEADQTTVQSAVTTALTELAKQKSRKLGESLTRNQIIGVVMRVSGVYDVTVVSPESTVVIGTTQVLVAGVNVQMTGTYNPDA